jgi:NTE family protein
MLDEVDTITGVSGGSFTASPSRSRRAPLHRIRDTIPEAERPGPPDRGRAESAQLGDLASPRYGRSDLAAGYYDDILFDHATFGDILGKPDTPRIW